MKYPHIKILQILIYALLLCCPIGAAQKPLLMPRLDCAESLIAKVQERLRLDCRLVNSGEDDLYLLIDRLSLEGPIGGKIPYLYVLIDWDRKENVLQYNFAAKKTLDLPSLFHPLAHLTMEDLDKLVLIRRGAGQDVTIYWQFPPGPDYPSAGNWLARVKLIYLTARDAAHLLQPKILTAACRLRLREGLERSTVPREIVLEAKHLSEARGWADDGCRDVISDKFQHLVSKTITLRVKEVGSSRGH